MGLFRKNQQQKEAVPDDMMELLHKAVGYWIFLYTVKELRSLGYEGQPQDMPEHIKSAIMQCMFGATIAVQEDLSGVYDIEAWVTDSRSRIPSVVGIKDDVGRFGLELSRALGSVEDGYTTFILDGAYAIRDYLSHISKGQDPIGWLKTYEGMFASSITLFLDDR